MRSEDDVAWRSRIIDIYKKADIPRIAWREAIYRLVRPERRYRTRYVDGDKRALMDIIIVCAEENVALPKWASEAIVLADDRYVTGQLNSWDDVFGKSFPGKRRAGLLTRARKREVWRTVVRLKHEGCPSADLFETAAKDLAMGASTVRDLYYSMEKDWRFPKSSP